MPKITRHGGPSTAGAAAGGSAAPAPARVERVEITPLEQAEPEFLDVVVPEGGDDVSPGSSSSTSSAKAPTTPEPKPANPRRRARTTASRSTRARTGNSSARPTDGGPTTSEN